LEVEMQTIYLVPHSHYDVAWALTKEEYLNVNEDVLRQAVELMKKHEEYKFCWEQIFPLKALEERNPELWREIKEMIQKGKMEIVDGQYLMADTMLPAGEVLIREIFFGKRYCQGEIWRGCLRGLVCGQLWNECAGPPDL
jgi:alpha-mannosidase